MSLLNIADLVSVSFKPRCFLNPGLDGSWLDTVGLAKTARNHNTQNTTQKFKHTTTNMGHHHLTLQRLFPLLPWQHPP